MTTPNPTTYRPIKRCFATLQGTPLHPQWFVFRHQEARLTAIGHMAGGRVLDIGCADQKTRRYLSTDCTYIGLDYYLTASQWYSTRPQVYGDASALPFPAEGFDWILLLDVLEHLPDPDACIDEIARVLKPGGKLVLQVPFLYPVHDAPLDFQRWTLHGLRRLARKAGLTIVEETPLGNTLESAALLANLALSKIVLDWSRRKNPLAILTVVLPFFILSTNVLAWALSPLVVRDDFMPFGYTLVLKKQ